jgi:hypothetical protein
MVGRRDAGPRHAGLHDPGKGMNFMFRSHSQLFLLTTSLVLGACVADDGDAADTEDSVDQAITAPAFRLQSTVFTNQVIAPINTQPGNLVTLVQQGGFGKEFWRFENQQLINNANPSLCLQSSSTASGAAVIVATCVDPFDITINPPQFWKMRLRPNGTTVWENLVSNHLDLDGSASHGVMRIQPFSGQAGQAFKRLF